MKSVEDKTWDILKFQTSVLSWELYLESFESFASTLLG